MKTLYKKDSKGKTRVWKIWTKGASLIQEAGLLDGKLIRNEKVCTPKNVGKSNATTGSEQALLELESSYLSKLDEGYFKTIKEVENTEVILPMLAKSYNDYKDKIDWNTAYIQPKLDGMRCLAIIKDGKVFLKSRDGKEIQNMEHIIKELSTIGGNWIFDGELYAHGKNFQENMRLIKKYRENETEQVKYHVYDLISKDAFINRFQELAEFSSDLDSVELVPTKRVKYEKELKTVHAMNLNQGYEGSIVRWGTVGYKIDGRSENLLKYKDFQDIACEIINIEPAEQRPEWGVPVLKYKGKEFRAGMKYSHDERKEFLLNKKKYIGKTAEIRFFEYSDDGIPRFPVMVGIRLDK